ncbi:MAG TPA: methyltransferase domain-containing protein [Desulfuromonadales bacterium]|nr:methyltransferase domain-containing protein [Desulfuromonadales bacterium]
MSMQHHRDAFRGNPAENYERYFVPAIGGPLAQELVKAAKLRPGEHVLDVACGTGVVARLAAEAVGKGGVVAGLDVNPGMLAVARSIADPEAGIKWHEASVESMPFPDASFDVVLCQMGLQFVSDKQAALKEMRRVLAPGGRLVFNVPGPAPEILTIMAEGIAHKVGAEPAKFVEAVFSLYDTKKIENLMSAAGFNEAAARADTMSLSLPSPEDFLWQYMQSTPLAAVVSNLPDETCASLEREVVGRWQEFVEDDALKLQLRMVMATAQK